MGSRAVTPAGPASARTRPRWSLPVPCLVLALLATGCAYRGDSPLDRSVNEVAKLADIRRSPLAQTELVAGRPDDRVTPVNAGINNSPKLTRQVGVEGSQTSPAAFNALLLRLRALGVVWDTMYCLGGGNRTASGTYAVPSSDKRFASWLADVQLALATDSPIRIPNVPGPFLQLDIEVGVGAPIERQVPTSKTVSRCDDEAAVRRAIG